MKSKSRCYSLSKFQRGFCRAGIGLLVCSLFLHHESHQVAASPLKYEKLLFLVFDQMRPDYIDKYELKNFRRLRNISVEYQNAFVGHLPSVTVVSHPVMNLGIPPASLPWKDNIFLDEKGALGQQGDFYSSHSLSTEDFRKLQNELPQGRSLQSLLRKQSKKRIFVVAEKFYAAMSFGIPEEDSIITLEKRDRVCRPAGINVPEYIAKEPRFELECGAAYGTEDAFYPIDGARLTPGKDPLRQGGDVWVGDVAQKLMEREDWQAIFLSFGGIDKLGHLWGDIDKKRPHPFKSDFTFESALKVADQELGRLLDYLEKKGLLTKTLIVVTADHGAQSNTAYLGNASGDSYGDIRKGGLGKTKPDRELKPKKEPPFWISRLTKFASIRATSHDTAVRVWLSPENAWKIGTPGEQRFLDAFAEISGVVQIFRLTQTSEKWIYTSVFTDADALNPWGRAHNQGLVDSLASSNAPHYIALLQDGFGFDLLGDHGGAQERVQRIPLFISEGASGSSKSLQEIRLQDLRHLIIEKMGLQDDAP